MTEWAITWEGNAGRTADGLLSATLDPATGVEMNDGGTLWECGWEVWSTDPAIQKAIKETYSDDLDGDRMSGVARSELGVARAMEFARVFAEAAAARVYMELERGGW